MFVMPSPASVFDVSCVLHVHSTYSDGSATVPELLEAARGAGADAVLLTDHDSLQARRDGWEGIHDGVLLVVGTEVSPREGHYLAFGVTDEIAHAGRSALEIAEAVRAAGGIGFAAHPFSVGGHMLLPGLARRIVRPHGWPALADPRGYDGVELWSLTTDAAEGWRTPAEAVRWLRDPRPQSRRAHRPIICAAGMSSRLIGACPRSAGSTVISPASGSADVCTLRFHIHLPSTCCVPTCCATAR
jgi:hypothetical protein